MPTEPASALEEATHCKREKACLHGECPRCEVEQILGEDLIFVKDYCHCAYNVSFGHTYACRCPVRRCACRHRGETFL